MTLSTHGSVMAATATPENCIGEIFSIDNVIVVLSRSAVDTLAKTCSAWKGDGLIQENITTGEAFTSHEIDSSVFGSRRRPAPSSGCLHRRYSAPVRRHRALNVACKPRLRTTGDGLSPGRARSKAPSVNASPAAISTLPLLSEETPGRSGRAAGRQACASSESASVGLPPPQKPFVERITHASVPASVNAQAVLKCKTTGVGYQPSAYFPTEDLAHRGQRRGYTRGRQAFRKEAFTGASEEHIGTSASVSIPAACPEEKSRVSNRSISKVPAERNDESQKRVKGCSTKDSTAGHSLGAVHSYPRAQSGAKTSENNPKLDFAQRTGELGAGSSRSQLFCVPPRLKHVHKFLAAALRAARSSLYVCLPLRVAESVPYPRQHPVTCAHTHADDGTTWTQGEVVAAAGAQNSVASSATQKHKEVRTAEVARSDSPSSVPSGKYHNNSCGSAEEFCSAPIKVASAVAACGRDIMAVTAAPPLFPAPTGGALVCSRMAAAAFSPRICAPASSKKPAAAAATSAVPVVCAAQVPFFPSSAWHDCDNRGWMKGASMAAFSHAYGLCCTYKHVGPGQQVATPICCVLRMIYHIYAFLSKCAAAFAPFTADVYVVPVWVDTGQTEDARATYNVGAAASTASNLGGKNIGEEKLAAGASAVVRDCTTAAPAAASIVDVTTALEGERAAGGANLTREVTRGRSLDTVWSAPSRRQIRAAKKRNEVPCTWQYRLLKAVQSHCMSCGGLRGTEGNIVNLVDPNFEIADWEFAGFSSSAGGLRTHSPFLQSGALDESLSRSFVELLSTLKIPTAPAPAEAVAPNNAVFETQNCVEKRDLAGPLLTAGASRYATKGAVELEKRAHVPAAVDASEDATWPAEEPVAGGAATAGAAEATETHYAEGTAVTANTEAESGAIAAVDTAEHGATAGTERAGCELTQPPFAGEVCRFRHVIVAGTFDRLHAGHKLLLTVATMLSSERLSIGLTAGALVQKKASDDAAEAAAAAVEPFAMRAHSAAAFVALIVNAAQAVAPPGPVGTTKNRSAADALPGAASTRKNRTVHKYGDDAAAATSDTLECTCTDAGVARSEKLEMCKGGRGEVASEAAGIAGSAGRLATPDLSEDTCSGADSYRTVRSVIRVAEEQNKEACTPLRAAPADEREGEDETALVNTMSSPVNFVNYCQAILLDEICKPAFEVDSDYKDYACLRGHDADVGVPRLPPCDVGTENEGRLKPLAGRAEAKGAEQPPHTARGEECETAPEDAAHGAEGNVLESDLNCGVTHEGRQRAVEKHQQDENVGMWTTDTTAAAEVSIVTDGAVGALEDGHTAATGSSAVSNEERQERQGRQRPWTQVVEELHQAEQLRREEVDVETREKQWTQFVFDAAAETQTSLVAFDEATCSVRKRCNSMYISVPVDTQCTVESPKSSFRRLHGKCFRPDLDCVLSPWTTLIVSPDFFFRCTRLASCGMPSENIEGAEKLDRSYHTCTAGSLCAFPPGARATRSKEASARVSALAGSVTSSTSSPAALPLSTLSSASPYVHRASASPLSSSFSMSAGSTRAARTSAAAFSPDLQRSATHDAPSDTSVSPQHAGPHAVGTHRPTCPSAPLRVCLMPIEDRLGPAGDVAFDALVLSTETLAGGFYVNEERIRRSHPPVCLVEVPALFTSDPGGVPRALAASDSERPARGPDTEHISVSVGKNASSFPPVVTVRTHFGKVPAPAKSSVTSPAEIRQAAAGHPFDSSGLANNHGSASAFPVHAGSLTISSVIHGQPVISAAMASSASSDRESPEETGERELQLWTCEDFTRRVSLSTGQRSTAEKCIREATQRDSEGETEGWNPVAYRTCAHSACNSEDAKTKHAERAAELSNKVSSSKLRQQQAAAIRNKVDIVALQQRFLASVNALLHAAPEPVWKAYWSFLCSLYMAPWRRVFTLERLARLLSRVEEAKQRVGGLTYWSGTCDAVVCLSLYCAYAVHPPPGLRSHRLSAEHSASSSVASTSHGAWVGDTPVQFGDTRGVQKASENKAVIENPHLCCGRSVLHETDGGHTGGLLLDSSGSQKHESEATNVRGCSSALESSVYHSFNDGVSLANEVLMRGLMRDVAVCSRLRKQCFGLAWMKQQPKCDASKESPTCEHQKAKMKDGLQEGMNSFRLDGDLNSNSLQGAANGAMLRLLISCIRTARESCAFILPCGLSSPVLPQLQTSPACGCFCEDTTVLRGEAELTKPDAIAHNGQPCLTREGTHQVLPEAVLSDVETPALQMLEDKCCQVLRMLELFELALPAGIYDLSARRMREEYYHLSDRHYADCRSEQLKNLHTRLFEEAHGLTGAEVALIKQNLLREQQKLQVDDTL